MGIVIALDGHIDTSMEAQDEALRETAIAVLERQITACTAELAKLQAEHRAIKQRTGIYA